MQKVKPHYIVYIASCPFPYGNASDNAIFTLMSGFNEHGCEGEVVCLYPRLPRQYTTVPPVGVFEGVHYRYLHNKVHCSRSRIINRINNKYRVYWLLKKYMRSICDKYDVTALFETHVSETYYRLSRICHDAGAKVILRACEYPEYLINDTPQRRDQFRVYAQFTDKYILETKTLEDYYKEALQQPISTVVIPATMPFEDILECKKTPDEPYIAYCGSIHSDAKDGLTNIIRAYSEFHDTHKTIRLKFIGRISRENYYKELQSLVQQLGLTDSISFTGEVNRKEYVQHLVNAELMMVAKPTDSYYGGGLSSKVMEYLFSGNPVVMVAADDYVHYLTHGENVYFAKDNAPETLSAALNTIFSDEIMRRRIGMNGKTYAMENFNFHKLTEKLLPFVLN